MMRPPALNLKLDNRFPHPVRTPIQPKTTSFVSQLYKGSWKNFIIAVAGLNGLRYAFASYNAFGDAAVDDMEETENLFTVSVALGVMYLIAFLVEIYGIVSVSMQRLSLIRGYVYLTFLAAVLLTCAGVLKGVSFFLFAEEIMWECVSLAAQGRGYEKSLFRSHPWPGSVFPMTQDDARKHCVYAWVHSSWSQVASIFLFSLVPAVVYYTLVYTYYRQTVDPGHPANLKHRSRQMVSAVRAEAYPQVGYGRVAGNDNDGNSSGMISSRLQPSQTPRIRSARRRDAQTSRSLRGVGAHASIMEMGGRGRTKPTFTSRSLQRGHRPPPLMPSPSPLGLTPGPPTYGPSRVYAAFAAPISDSEYDKSV